MALEKSVKQVLILGFCLASSVPSLMTSAQETQISNVHPVHIGAEGHVVQGHISAEAGQGQLVPYNVVVEGHEDTDIRLHLRVEVRNSVYKRPYLYHPDIKIDTSDPGNPQMEHPVEQFLNRSLPYGVEFVVIHTEHFYVNEEWYIAVKDLSSYRQQTRVHFDVILRDKLAEKQYVSNPLPFVVDVEFPKLEQNSKALLFAGVLVLAIVAISLIIPFGVRARRRCKVGKPIFGCGSADVFEEECADSVPYFLRNRANSVGGKDNLAMILEHGHTVEHRSSIDPHTSIQKRMLMSTSSIKFQPRWMDPHYNDVYNRPDFSHVKRKRSSKKHTAGVHSKLPPTARLISNSNSRTSPSNSRTSPSNSRNSPNLSNGYLAKNNSDKNNGTFETEHPVFRSVNGVPANCDLNGCITENGDVFTTRDGMRKY